MRGMTKRGKILLGAGAVPLLLMLYLFAWPVPIEPIAWGAPVFNPDAWKTTGTLATAERIELSVTSTNSWPGSTAMPLAKYISPRTADVFTTFA